MYRREEFRDWFALRGYKPNTVTAHLWHLSAVDRVFDLDKTLTTLGIDGTLDWARRETTGPFEKYPSNMRSAVNRYVEFIVSTQAPNIMEEDGEGNTEPVLFQLEREMQAAVRKQLSQLEPGLRVDDGGSETPVATGKIDILARDRENKLVAIELKSGRCPTGALEQVLGYAEALSEERNEPVRAYLIAGEFPTRILVAARRARDLHLRSYQFSITFTPVSEERG
jgi:hypothetical protein